MRISRPPIGIVMRCCWLCQQYKKIIWPEVLSGMGEKQQLEAHGNNTVTVCVFVVFDMR
jgi:hypothetical protein